MNTRTIYSTILLTILAANTIACPGDDATTNDMTTIGTDGTSTNVDISSTTDANSSTGDTSPTTGSTTDVDTSTTELETTSSGGGEINCGVPNMECEMSNREWCPEIDSLCKTTALSPPPGSTQTDYCINVANICAEGMAPCQLCNYIAGTCSQLGGGTACDDALTECLCLAQAHGQSLN